MCHCGSTYTSKSTSSVCPVLTLSMVPFPMSTPLDWCCSVIIFLIHLLVEIFCLLMLCSTCCGQQVVYSHREGWKLSYTGNTNSHLKARTKYPILEVSQEMHTKISNREKKKERTSSWFLMRQTLRILRYPRLGQVRENANIVNFPYWEKQLLAVKKKRIPFQRT